MNFEELLGEMTAPEAVAHYMIGKLSGKLKEFMPREEYETFIDEVIEGSIRLAMSRFDNPVIKLTFEAMLYALKERAESRKERNDG